MRRALVVLCLVLSGFGVPGQAVAKSCSAVLFVGAMGSGQHRFWATSSGLGLQVDMVRQQLQSSLSQSMQVHAIDYPAQGISVLIPGQSVLPSSIRDRAAAFFLGLSQGIDKTYTYLVRQANACPNQKIVLAGYSQGAMVMHRVMSRLVRMGQVGIVHRIVGAVLVADGDLAPASGAVRIGNPAAQGEGLSYSLWRTPDVPSQLIPRTYNVCTENDVVCDWEGATSLALLLIRIPIHLGYRDAPLLQQATDRVVANVEAS